MMTVDSRKIPSKPQSSLDSRFNTSAMSEDCIKDICCDFLCNVCKHGHHCKYWHPLTSELWELAKHHKLTFCYDFQNTDRWKANCCFIHYTWEEEGYYKQDSYLYACSRSRCKYRHISSSEYQTAHQWLNRVMSQPPLQWQMVCMPQHLIPRITLHLIMRPWHQREGSWMQPLLFHCHHLIFLTTPSNTWQYSLKPVYHDGDK